MHISRRLTNSATTIDIKGYYCEITNNSSESGFFSIDNDPVRGSEHTIEIKSGSSRTFCHSCKPIRAIGNGDFFFFGFDNLKKTEGEIEETKILSLANKYTDQHTSNPNLLINPDFSINQRGKQIYASGGYSVDKWFLSHSGSGNSGVFDVTTRVLSGSVIDTNGFYVNMQQYIENPVRFADMEMTLSASMSDLNKGALIQVWRTEGSATTGIAATQYNLESEKKLTFTMPSDLTTDSKIRMVLQTRGSVKINWAKLELGSVATPFITPDKTLEELKCLNEIGFAGCISTINNRTFHQ